MAAATFVNRTYTPLAFREETERWLIATLAVIVAVLYVVVIPLEIVLHAGPPPVPQAQPAARV